VGLVLIHVFVRVCSAPSVLLLCSLASGGAWPLSGAELQVAALCDRSQLRVKGAGGEAGDYALTGMTQPSIK